MGAGRRRSVLPTAMLHAPDYAGPIGVTVGYVALYYAFQINILRVKTRLGREAASRGERFDRYFSQDRSLLAADRMQLNTLEHMPVFLALLWLNAAFVSIESATLAGAIYVGARALYPFVMGARLGRGVRALIMLSTVPGYVVIAWFCAALAWTAL